MIFFLIEKIVGRIRGEHIEDGVTLLVKPCPPQGNSEMLPLAQPCELTEDAIRNIYSVTVRNKYEGLEDKAKAGQRWRRLCWALDEAANEVVPKRKGAVNETRMDNGGNYTKN